VAGKQVIELLEKLRTEEEATLIVVTHDPELGQRAERQIRIVDGRIDRDIHALN
jgi:putative ABC transport system ATP-binding protein